MNTIEKMNKIKSEKILNGFIRYNNQTITKKEWLNELFKSGYKPEIGTTCPIKYNRVKFNRMNWKEQQEYEKKLSERITEYRAICKSGSYYPLTKTEYDYFDSICYPDASESELKHLFGLN